MGREHRQSERHRITFKIVYDDGSSFNAGYVLDVSESGVFLETALPLPVGSVLRLTPLDHAGDRLFEVNARVMRAIPYDPTTLAPPGMGLMFIDLTEEQRGQITEMISNLIDKVAHIEGELDPFLGVRLPSYP